MNMTEDQAERLIEAVDYLGDKFAELIKELEKLRAAVER